MSFVFALVSGREVIRVLEARPLPPTVWARIFSAPLVTLVGCAAGVSLIVDQGPGLYIEAVLFVSAFPVVAWNAWEAIWPPASYRRPGKHN